MQLSDQNLKTLLLRENYVEKDAMQKAEDYALNKQISLLDSLLANGEITYDLLGQAIAESLRVRYADLNTNKPAYELMQLLPGEVASNLRVIPFSEERETITLTTDDPTRAELLSELQAYFPNKKISLAYSLPTDIDKLLIIYRPPLADRLLNLIETAAQVAPELVNEIITEATVRQASDIHIEPQEDTVQIRFRIDGRLQLLGELPVDYYSVLVNRIKVLAHLRIDDHFSAQDGSFRLELPTTKIDLRVSILPTLIGEKIVMRLLNAYVRSLNLEELGLSAEQLDLLNKAAAKPFGMILVSGPTGSGKTTTLYGVLKVLNNLEVNISTIEDPVEYRIKGVNHIQVNPETQLTFSEGLRSIVRQDPDIILVGEIRDHETAEIAVNSALTGHLVLSTFHANNASTVIPRLMDMEVEPFLLSSTLELIVAQRLVRKLCDHCRYSVEIDRAQLERDYPTSTKYLGETNKIYAAKGCDLCNNTGFAGRTAVYEMISVTAELKDLILKNPSSQQISELALSQGTQSLFVAAMEKVRAGVTTLAEVSRVIQIPNAEKTKATTKAKPKK